MRITTARGDVTLHRAWHIREVHAALEGIVGDWAARGKLPERRDARIVLKPNLNNDLVALTGNSTDPRVLAGLVRALQARGYTDLTLADGSNVGVDRRGIDSFKRLRIDALARALGVRTMNLNQDAGRVVTLRGGAAPRVATTILDADCYISVPTLKTHVEAGLSCALKNQVGICVGQDKREMHRDLPGNILALGLAVRPHLVVVDALVAMEGNGPGDGAPARMDLLLAGDDAFLVDLVAARVSGLGWERVPYLRKAVEEGHLAPQVVAQVEAAVAPVRVLDPAPPRGRLAELADSPRLRALKLAARPLTDRPEVAQAAYRLGVLQDVYGTEDDTLRIVAREDRDCESCRACEAVCPTGLPLADIGVRTALPDCTNCLQCWWVCPREAIRVEGSPNAMARQIGRYKAEIEGLAGEVRLTWGGNP